MTCHKVVRKHLFPLPLANFVGNFVVILFLLFSCFSEMETQILFFYLIQITLCAGQKYPFTFDKVFNHEASQENVFVEISQLVQSALDGYKVKLLFQHFDLCLL